MTDARAWLFAHAPWLAAAELGTCVVGSSALAEACRRAGVPGPTSADLDLAWGLDLDAGRALLERQGVHLATTTANQERGTLAMKVAGRRIEVTTFRAGVPTASLEARLLADLAERDMTVGALAWRVADDAVLDPHDGFGDWRARRVVAVGDPRRRIVEHPVRWVRYYRRAHEWGFELDPRVRKLVPDPEQLARIVPEALAAELRAALVRCASPGTFLLELQEAGLLQILAPPLAPQFDGRPAGPVRWHPEVSQALHLILCLEWAAERGRALPENERFALQFAVLCHDLGKSDTPAVEFPRHRGHEAAGEVHIDALCDALPSLADAATRRLAKMVARLHLEVRRFDELRPGTRARLYDRDFRAQDAPVRLFALAVGADVGGRLGCAAEGDAVAQRVERDLRWLRARAGSIDAGALRRANPDVERFREALHEARARALAGQPDDG